MYIEVRGLRTRRRRWQDGPENEHGNARRVHLHMALADVGTKPLQTLVEAVSRGCTCSLNEPSSLPETVEAKFVGDFSGIHGVRKILLIGEDKEEGVAELILIKHALELLTGLGYTLAIVRVDHKDNALCILEVVPPEGTDLVLPSDVPDCERDILVFDGLHVESNCGDCGDYFTKLELIEDGRLAGSIETDHENSHLLFAEEGLKSFAKCHTHGC